MNLDHLLQRADLWRGVAAPPSVASIPTGFSALDTLFPGGGWPKGALTEILVPRKGIGALSLVLPTLARLSREKRWLAWVAPPYLPYAPALASAGIDLSRVLLVHGPGRPPGRFPVSPAPRVGSDGLWAVEQALRSGTCGAVLAWLETGDMKTLRRLQLAAEAGCCWGLLFRPEHLYTQASPAALRIKLEPEPEGLAVHILKRRGGWATGPVHVKFR